MAQMLTTCLEQRHYSTNQIQHSLDRTKRIHLTDGFTSVTTGLGTTAQSGTNPGALNPSTDAKQVAYDVGQGMRTDDAEDLGDSSKTFNEMGFLNRESYCDCEVKSLKAQYSLELAKTLRQSTD